MSFSQSLAHSAYTTHVYYFLFPLILQSGVLCQYMAGVSPDNDV